MTRERLTITLDSDLLDALDSTIDRSQIRNRSHAIEHFIREGLALHQFKKAFLFITEEWNTSTLPKLITTCDSVGIQEYFLVQTPITASIAAAASTSIGQLSQNQPKITTIPGDFGTGGALVLKRAELTSAFLLIHCGANLAIPNTLLGAYAFHRRQGTLVTQVVISGEQGEFAQTGMAIANPELVREIPAGMANIEENVFPDLVKAGKVSAYVYAN